MFDKIISVRIPSDRYEDAVALARSEGQTLSAYMRSELCKKLNTVVPHGMYKSVRGKQASPEPDVDPIADPWRNDRFCRLICVYYGNGQPAKFPWDSWSPELVAAFRQEDPQVREFRFWDLQDRRNGALRGGVYPPHEELPFPPDGWRAPT